MENIKIIKDGGYPNLMSGVQFPVVVKGMVDDDVVEVSNRELCRVGSRAACDDPDGGEYTWVFRMGVDAVVVSNDHGAPKAEQSSHDEISNPAHYDIFDGQQAIDIIRKALTPEEFAGYCKGNFLKYRLRAGEKGDATKCLAKSNWYRDYLRGLDNE